MVDSVTKPTAAPTDARYKRLIGAMMKHRKRQDALIEILHVTEDVFGYLPLEVMQFISREMKIPPSRIYGVATFYHFFSLKPRGEHACVVCTGTACYVKGAQGIIDRLENEFHLKDGETTPDNKLGLRTARCVGACGMAPVVMVDADIHGKADPSEIISAVRKKIGA